MDGEQTGVVRKRKRLLIVVGGMGVGGAERQIQQLLISLDRERWEPELAYFRYDSFLLEPIRRNGVRMHHFSKRGRVDISFLMAFTRLLRRRNYALVHAFSLTGELWAMLSRDLSGRRIPLIVSERSSGRTDKPSWYWMLKRIVIARSAAVIANSLAGAQSTAHRTRTLEAKFVVVGNGVGSPAAMHPLERADMRRAIGIPNGRTFGLFVGRLVEEKNLPCLVKAVASLPPALRPWFALVGRGPLRSSLESLAAASGVSENILLLGEVENPVSLMQAADFLVLPSHYEGQSNALLEAMAAGCPVIASKVGGTPEIVQHGQTGLLFPPNDVDALAKAIMTFAANPALREQLAANAREFVIRNHSLAALATSTSAVYERCLAGADPRATVNGTRAFHRAAKSRKQEQLP